jgi:hypothetical protein
MPWFEPNPSQDQLDFWQGHPAANRRKISKWPHSNTIRIDPKYRVKDTDPTMIPLASRYGLYYSKPIAGYDPDDTEFNASGWWDLAVIDENHIGVTTEENDAGYTVEINIQHFEELEEDGGPGIELCVEFDHASFGKLKYFEEHPADGPTNLWKYDMNTFVFSEVGQRRWEHPDPPYDQLLLPRLFAVPECELFPFLPVGMAAMNGSDSYITLDHNIPRLDVPFKISADIRLHNVTSHWPLFGLDGQGGFTGMNEDDTIFGFLTLPTSWVPVLDEWFNWRFEFEQVSQLNYRTFIDDVLVDETTGGRQFSHRNTIGVYKHGVSGTIWADMDVKNLKVTIGDVPSSNVVLDMPLIDNALDLSDDANHGTTFNMALPSV